MRSYTRKLATTVCLAALLKTFGVTTATVSTAVVGDLALTRASKRCGAGCGRTDARAQNHNRQHQSDEQASNSHCVSSDVIMLIILHLSKLKSNSKKCADTGLQLNG